MSESRARVQDSELISVQRLRARDSMELPDKQVDFRGGTIPFRSSYDRKED